MGTGSPFAVMEMFWNWTEVMHNTMGVLNSPELFTFKWFHYVMRILSQFF